VKYRNHARCFSSDENNVSSSSSEEQKDNASSSSEQQKDDESTLTDEQEENPRLSPSSSDVEKASDNTHLAISSSEVDLRARQQLSSSSSDVEPEPRPAASDDAKPHPAPAQRSTPETRKQKRKQQRQRRNVRRSIAAAGNSETCLPHLSSHAYEAHSRTKPARKVGGASEDCEGFGGLRKTDHFDIEWVPTRVFVRRRQRNSERTPMWLVSYYVRKTLKKRVVLAQVWSKLTAGIIVPYSQVEKDPTWKQGGAVPPDVELALLDVGTAEESYFKPKTKATTKPSKKAERKSGDPEHVGFCCDGCGQNPIIGARFTCTQCSEYDLCSVCEAKGIHAEHDFIKVKAPIMTPKTTKAPSSSGNKQSTPKQPRGQARGRAAVETTEDEHKQQVTRKEQDAQEERKKQERIPAAKAGELREQQRTGTSKEQVDLVDANKENAQLTLQVKALFDEQLKRFQCAVGNTERGAGHLPAAAQQAAEKSDKTLKRKQPTPGQIHEQTVDADMEDSSEDESEPDPKHVRKCYRQEKARRRKLEKQLMYLQLQLRASSRENLQRRHDDQLFHDEQLRQAVFGN
jgi:hypothetical protein